jgi:NADH-quinone oxidoreductase subunit F
MPTLVSHPDEVKVVSRRFGMGATDIDKYVELDGYKAVQMGIENGPQWIIDTMKASGLRGRGGAGFPTGMKWSFVPKESAKPKYVLVNGDESEPGTCKDHVLFLHDPHSVIEGTMIAGLAIGSKVGFIYLRGEYRYLLNIVEKAVADAYARQAQEPTRSAKSPRSWSRSKASAAFPASNRHFRQSSASTAARPSSTTPRPSPTLRTSC